MELNVYSAEKFERNKWRYIILAFIMAIVVFVCIYYKNRGGIIFMFLILGGYIYMCLINIKEVKLKISDEGLILGDRLIPWTILTGYVIEINKNDQQIKNIVLLSEKQHSIHTISDSIENIKTFLSHLDEYIPMVGEYEQTNLEKLSRILKL